MSTDDVGIVADGAARWLEGEKVDFDRRVQALDERLSVATDADERQQLLEQRVAMEDERRRRLEQVEREAKDALF